MIPPPLWPSTQQALPPAPRSALHYENTVLRVSATQRAKDINGYDQLFEQLEPHLKKWQRMEVHADPGAGVWTVAQRAVLRSVHTAAIFCVLTVPAASKPSCHQHTHPDVALLVRLLGSDLMPGTVSIITYTCTKWGLYAYLNEVRIGIGLVWMHKFS